MVDKITIDVRKIGRTIANRLGVVTKEQSHERALRAYESGYEDGNDDPQEGTIAAGGLGYRTFASGGQRQTKVSIEKIINSAWSVHQSNPVANRGSKIKRDHILGRGVTIQADDEQVQDVLDEFWSSNQLNRRRLKEFVQQLFLFGTQCYPVFVRKTDGHVRLGYIDPQQIAEVVTHPENAMEPWAVVVKPEEGRASWAGVFDRKRVFRIIRQDEGFVDNDRVVQPQYPKRYVTAEQTTLEPWEMSMLKDKAGITQYTGSCLYFRVNNVSNQPVGWPDLLQVIDGLDQHSNTLFGLGEREQQAGYFFADVTVEGGDEEVQEMEKKLGRTAPKHGSLNVHNHKIKWDLNHPDLKQPASIQTAEALFDNAWGGMGFPRHWYVQGDTTNRATAQEQGAPTERTLQSDQDDIKEEVILVMLYFARDQALIAGVLKEQHLETPIDVIMPEVSKRDIPGMTRGINELVQGLLVAQQAGWTTQEMSTRIFAKIVSELGIEVDPNEALQALEDEVVGEAQMNVWLTRQLDGNGHHR